MNAQTSKDPLHGITLEALLTSLVERYGWAELAKIISINCFKSDPSIKSSLKFCAEPRGLGKKWKSCILIHWQTCLLSPKKPKPQRQILGVNGKRRNLLKTAYLNKPSLVCHPPAERMTASKISQRFAIHGFDSVIHSHQYQLIDP